MSALDDVLAAVAAAMHESASRWYLFGAQAATLWGEEEFLDRAINVQFEGTAVPVIRTSPLPPALIPWTLADGVW